jgi:hypothetical protein
VGGLAECLEDLPADSRIILKWILKKYCIRVWAGFIWLRIESGVGVYVHLLIP